MRYNAESLEKRNLIEDLMSLKIRLARAGAKKRPFYRIVVAENTAPRDGRFVEKIGSYNPLLEKDSPERLVVNEERAKHWLKVGAAATDRILKLFAELKILPAYKPSETPNKSAPKKKAQERMKSREAAVEA